MKVLDANLFTPKGNLKDAARKDFKAQMVAQITAAAPALTKTPNGDYAMAIGANEDGTAFYVTVNVTVGKADPFRVAEEKAVEVEDLDVPSIFEA